jgi:hypothetical protein
MMNIKCGCLTTGCKTPETEDVTREWRELHREKRCSLRSWLTIESSNAGGLDKHNVYIVCRRCRKLKSLAKKKDNLRILLVDARITFKQILRETR